MLESLALQINPRSTLGRLADDYEGDQVKAEPRESSVASAGAIGPRTHPSVAFAVERMADPESADDATLEPRGLVAPALPLRLAFSTLVLILLTPAFVANFFLYPCFRLLFGTLYPAYASYKAVRNKDVKAYVSTLFF